MGSEAVAVQIGIVFFAVTLTGAITALVWEVVNFVRGRTFISRRQWLWRIAGLLFLLCLLSLMFGGALLGRYHFRFPTARSAAIYWGSYLFILLLGVLILILMALKDLRWLASEEFYRKIQIYRRLEEELRRLSRGDDFLDKGGDGRREVDDTGTPPGKETPSADQP